MLHTYDMTDEEGARLKSLLFGGSFRVRWVGAIAHTIEQSLKRTPVWSKLALVKLCACCVGRRGAFRKFSVLSIQVFII